MTRLAIERLAGDPSTASFANRLRLWFRSDDSITLEDVLGVGSTWRSARRRQERDRLIQRIAGEYFAGLGGRPLAHAIAQAISAYETRSWPRERRTGRRRPGLPGLLFDLFTLGAPLLSEASIRTLVVRKSPRK